MREETVLTGRSGQLHGRLWIGEGQPRGVVIVVHGLGDHGGRYDGLAVALAEQDWATFAFDLPGHGLSPGGRGRADSFTGLLTDIAHARRTTSQQFGKLPHVILGHSMGGNLAINYALRRHTIEPRVDDLAGLVLSAPMLLPPKPPRRPHIFAAWLTGNLFPWIRVRRTVDAAALTSNSGQQAAIAGDPLTHSKITLYLATQLLSQGRWALDQARNVDLPTLIMLGEHDGLIDRSACDHLAIRIGDRATIYRFPQMWHDLLHESEPDQVFRCVGDWLQPFA